MDFKFEHINIVAPQFCLVCFGEINETVDPTFPSSERLTVLSNILRLSPTIYHGLNVDHLQDPLYCANCTNIILSALNIFQEIKNLENTLTVLTSKLKQDMIHGYHERRQTGDNFDLSSGGGGDEAINLIRKTLVQCWSDCHVQCETLYPTEGITLTESNCKVDGDVAEEEFDTETRVEEKQDDDDDYEEPEDNDEEDYDPQVKKNSKKSKSKGGKVVKKKKKYESSNSRLVGLRSLVTSKQQRSRTNLPFTCSLCGKGYQIESSLQLHEKCHAGDLPFQCSMCESKFVSKRSLHLHETRRHQKKLADKPYEKLPCNLCEKTFQTEQNLNAHVASVHENFFKYKCNVCNAGFNIKSALSKHEQYVHTTNKNFECEICKKRFKRSHQLFYHRRVHTGERLICEICGRGFMQPEKLKWHLEAHTGEKRYPCPYCGKLFAVKNYVSSHIYATHEGRRKPRCKNSISSISKPIETEQQQQHNIITFNIIESSINNKNETQIVVVSDNIPML